MRDSRDGVESPCIFCFNYCEVYDRFTGWYDCGCCVRDELWECGHGKPCPNFKSYLPSSDLYEQLFNEEVQENETD